MGGRVELIENREVFCESSREADTHSRKEARGLGRQYDTHQQHPQRSCPSEPTENSFRSPERSPDIWLWNFYVSDAHVIVAFVNPMWWSGGHQRRRYSVALKSPSVLCHRSVVCGALNEATARSFGMNLGLNRPTRLTSAANSDVRRVKQASIAAFSVCAAVNE